MEAKDQFTLDNQHYGFWWPGYTRNQGMRSHGVDLVITEYFGFSWHKIGSYILFPCMGAGGLVAQGTSASAATVLIWLSRTILSSAPDRLLCVAYTIQICWLPGAGGQGITTDVIFFRHDYIFLLKGPQSKLFPPLSKFRHKLRACLQPLIQLFIVDLVPVTCHYIPIDVSLKYVHWFPCG